MNLSRLKTAPFWVLSKSRPFFFFFWQNSEPRWMTVMYWNSQIQISACVSTECITHLCAVPQDTLTGMTGERNMEVNKAALSDCISYCCGGRTWGWTWVHLLEEITLSMFKLSYYPLNQAYMLMNQAVPIISQADHTLNTFPRLIHSCTVLHLLKAGVEPWPWF